MGYGGDLTKIGYSRDLTKRLLKIGKYKDAPDKNGVPQKGVENGK
ncbi:MAG: hypothetical protein AMQ22_00586 [Candidatus Methanofastidiosum methylothiophilum]|uniref:Uncharacterized protein n=1 Tax=Candidatus Methanofastidiosum methylothiophilum TaxID=1705564 RepID=A0A150J6P9_9EURY|nr:MAG: hypothetical protein AMQ22_00586 [Candidatus Methanofastidiosum methylthiophilus]